MPKLPDVTSFAMDAGRAAGRRCGSPARKDEALFIVSSGIAMFRRRLLRIHGTILALVALSSAVATTIGWRTGTGPFGFMHQSPMVWVGLIQAYLLMTIIAVLLVLGSGEANPRKWNVVGALAHCPPLIAALSSLPVFASMGVLRIVGASIAFHIVWFCLEAFAALYPDRRARGVT